MDNNQQNPDEVDTMLGHLAVSDVQDDEPETSKNESASKSTHHKGKTKSKYAYERPSKSLMECYPEVADDDNEKLYADIRRHWLGRVGIIATGVTLTVMLFAFAISTPSLLKSLDYNVSTSANAIISIVFLFVALLIGIGSFITLWVYNQSRLLITDQNVIELKQMSLFSHKVSHLNIINVEDVTVVKKGILQTIFDYGTLMIETAGERDNFSFPNTPTPDKYRRIVINNHEEAIERIGKLGNAQKLEISNNGF